MSVQNQTLDYICSASLYEKIKAEKVFHCYRLRALWQRRLEGENRKKYIYIRFRSGRQKESLIGQILYIRKTLGTEIGYRSINQYYDIKFRLLEENKMEYSWNCAICKHNKKNKCKNKLADDYNEYVNEYMVCREFIRKGKKKK